MSLREKTTEVQKVILKALPNIIETKQLTLNDKISKENYLNLKAVNKMYSGSARAIRQSAIKNKGAIRGHLRFLKSVEGQKARLFHVGLCFLRGKKYSEVEPNVDNKNKLTAKQLNGQLCYFVSREYNKILLNELEKFLES